jgi:hypothetical protein
MNTDLKAKLLEDKECETSKISYPEQKQRITLNVGGLKHEILWKTLNRFPNSKLGKLKKNLNSDYLNSLCDDYDAEKNEFFFDRDPTLFNLILNYYREGKLHINDNICPNVLQLELDYWEIDQPNMDLYCEEKLYHKQQAINEVLENYMKIFTEEKTKIEAINKIKSGKFSAWKNRIWNLVDNPFENKSSYMAMVFIKL